MGHQGDNWVITTILLIGLGVTVAAYFTLMVIFWLFGDGPDDHLR